MLLSQRGVAKASQKFWVPIFLVSNRSCPKTDGLKLTLSARSCVLHKYKYVAMFVVDIGVSYLPLCIAWYLPSSDVCLSVLPSYSRIASKILKISSDFFATW